MLSHRPLVAAAACAALALPAHASAAEARDVHVLSSPEDPVYTSPVGTSDVRISPDSAPVQITPALKSPPMPVTVLPGQEALPVSVEPGPAPLPVAPAPVKPLVASFSFAAGEHGGGGAWTVPAGKDFLLSYVAARGWTTIEHLDPTSRDVLVKLLAGNGDVFLPATPSQIDETNTTWTANEALPFLVTDRLEVRAILRQDARGISPWSITIVGTLVDE